MNEKNSIANKGWTVVIAGLSINLILGVLYAWGVVGKALVKTWHWKGTEAALPFTVATVCFAGMMVFAGRCQDKYGPRLVATAGGVMLGLGLLASGLVHSPTAMMLTFGVGAGLGIGLGYSATTPPAIKWFPPARKGVITGIVVSGVGLAAVYIAPLTQYLLSITTISMTFVWLGAGTLLLVPLLAQLLRNPPEQPAAAASTTKAAAAPRRESDWQEMLGTGSFYQLWLLMVLSVSAGMMIITQVAIIGKQQAGLDWGFVPIATLAVFNTFGRLLSGAVSDRIGRTRTMTLAFLLQAVNMLAFSHYNTPALVIFGSAFTGICYGGIFTLMPAATADFYGVRNLGVNYGLVFTGFGIAGVVGPMLGAGINDLYKSYDYAYQISAVMLVMGAGLAMLTKPPGTRAEPAASQPKAAPSQGFPTLKPNPTP
ncbi:MAG: OFA family MFS transporter [Verrucomicrobiota bacterium]|jgi:OFA family oxalate/formate antiporter-like MFS transporter